MPLSIALPAAATALAYLNAKHSLFYDVDLLKSMFKMLRKKITAEKSDRLNLFYVLENHALSPNTADKDFIVYNGRTWSFRETYDMALRFANWFKNVHNVGRKDIVAIDCMNSSTFLFMLLGLWSIGAVPALINYNLTGKPLTHSLKVSTAKLVIVDEEIRNNFTPELMETLASPHFRDGKGPIEAVFLTPHLESQVLEMEPMREEDQARAGLLPRDMALLIYTSGTTGLPKPAIVSLQKSWSSTCFVGNWLKMTATDRFFTVSTPSHS